MRGVAKLLFAIAAIVLALTPVLGTLLAAFALLGIVALLATRRSGGHRA